MEPIPLSLLNDFLFCQRRAALKLIEGCRGENEHTGIGDIAHEHADLPGYEIAKSVKLLRALPVWSERLGLSGRCDIVEQHPDGTLVPVEYKKSKRRRFENDDVQLCAQALCLEEIFGARIEGGAIFHAASKRRREVDFDTRLRALTETTVADLHQMMEAHMTPVAVLKPQCLLYEICLPQITSLPARVKRAAEELLRI